MFIINNFFLKKNMDAKTEVKLFKFVFGLAVFLFCVIVIALFLLLVKLLFIFFPQGFDIMGINFTSSNNIY